MTFLAWNCRGSGETLRSSKMTHLTRLLASTKAQVCFISETKNSTISRTSIINRFNAVDALWFLRKANLGAFGYFGIRMLTLL